MWGPFYVSITALCPNLPISSFIGDGKKTWLILNTLTLKHLILFKKIQGEFFFGHILTKGVLFNAAV
jgi:hypothetical protein